MFHFKRTLAVRQHRNSLERFIVINTYGVPVVWITAIFITLGVVDALWFSGQHTVNVVTRAHEIDATLERQIDRFVHRTGK